MFIIVRQFICKVSYALSIGSIARKTCVDNIMNKYYISLYKKRTPINDGISDRV